MTKILCIYHGGCDDGFGAAWAVRHALGDTVEFHPGAYGKPPPSCRGRDVLLVDFSYKRPIMADIAGEARSVLVLDHHKTAKEDLYGFSVPVGWGNISWKQPPMLPSSTWSAPARELLGTSSIQTRRVRQ